MSASAAVRIFPGRAVARVLDPGGAAGVDQDLRGEAQPLLGARNHHDLLRAAAHPARGGEVVGDRPAQFRLALRIAVLPGEARAPRQRARGKPLPGGDKAGVDLGMAGLERARQAARRRQVIAQPRGLARKQPRRARRRRAVRSRRAHRRSGEIAGAGSAGDITLGGELLEHADHGAAREAELARQRAGRRQPRPGPDAALADRLAQRRRQLARQRHRQRAVEPRRPQGRRRGGGGGTGWHGNKMIAYNSLCPALIRPRKLKRASI